MALYNNSPKGEVLLALQRENPKLSGVEGDFTFSTPIRVGGTSTTGKIRGVPGHGFTGGVTYTYNLLNFTGLMVGVNTRVQLFTLPNNDLNDVVGEVARLYGLNLLSGDFGTSPMGANTLSTNWNMTPVNSHQYVGSWGMTWFRGDKQVRDFFPNRTLGRTGDVTPMIKTHITPFDDMGDVLSAIPDGSVLTQDSDTLRALVATMAEKTGVAFVVTTGSIPSTDQLDLTGYTTKQRQAYTVSDAMPGYLYILELTPSPLSGGYTAPLYLHYGKVQLADIGAAIKTTALSGFAASDVS